MPEEAWCTADGQYISVLDSNRYMLDNEVACDVTFSVSYPGVGTKLVRAHRYMLIARNPVFRAMLCGNFTEHGDKIAISDVHPTALRKIIRYLYCEAIDITEDDVFDILYASKKYLISSITKRCFSFLEACITTETVCPIFNCAVFYDEDALVKKCLRHVALHAKEVMDSDDFSELSKEAISLVVQSQVLNVSEDELLTACIKWCRSECERLDQVYSPPCLKLYLGDSFYHLRISDISENLLWSCILSSGVLSDSEEESLKLYLSNEVETCDQDMRNALGRFNFDKRQRVEVGEVHCDLATKMSGTIIIFDNPTVHTFTISEEILLCGVDITDSGQSCMTGVHIAIIQDSKTIFQTGIKVSAARRESTYGPSIPLNLPKQVHLHAGEFSVSLHFKSLYGRNVIAGCCMPPRKGVECNGVLIKPVYSETFHIGSLCFSIL